MNKSIQRERARQGEGTLLMSMQESAQISAVTIVDTVIVINIGIPTHTIITHSSTVKNMFAHTQ